jgi:hypothetical protein
MDSLSTFSGAARVRMNTGQMVPTFFNESVPAAKVAQQA